VGLGFDFPGQIVAQVLLAPGAAAAGIAASAADGDEAGGQDRAFGLEWFLAGLEGATDQRGMFGYFHDWGWIFAFGNMNSIKAYQIPAQNGGLRQLFSAGGAARSPAVERPSQDPGGREKPKSAKTPATIGGKSPGATPDLPDTQVPAIRQLDGQGAKSAYVTGLRSLAGFVAISAKGCSNRER
jgi:hypothetical protein